jgi:L-asparaginase
MTLLSITISPWYPFRVTGAIRRWRDLSADEEINMHNTACLVVSPEAKDRGVNPVSQNYVFEALSVIKVSTTSVNAFKGIKIGKSGVSNHTSTIHLMLALEEHYGK